MSLNLTNIPSTYSLDELKNYHSEAMQFFAAELMLLKEAVPQISDERLSKPAVLLISSGQTGAALLQLANQTDTFTKESVMLARSFMEKLTNFCYVGLCDENDYHAFILHPIYKHYHLIGAPKIEDDLGLVVEEAWGDGLVMYHNPKAKHPVDINCFQGISHMFFDKDRLIVYGYPEPNNVLNSMTVVFIPEQSVEQQ